MLTFEHASCASQGARSYQEDASAVWPGQSPLAPPNAPPMGLHLIAVLADGMGGHAAGDVASHLVCETFLRAVGDDGSVPDRLLNALDAANAAIRDKTDADPALSGMGATIIGIALSEGDKADWVSVGDSPLYLWRSGDMIRLNEDHSLAPMLDKLVEEGKMTREQALADHRRHHLRSAVTGEELDLVDLSQHPLELHAGDILIVASDGLLTLSEDEIRRVVAAYRAETVDAIARALLHAVVDIGQPHQDNTTLVVVRALGG